LLFWITLSARLGLVSGTSLSVMGFAAICVALTPFCLCAGRPCAGREDGIRKHTHAHAKGEGGRRERERERERESIPPSFIVVAIGAELVDPNGDESRHVAAVPEPDLEGRVDVVIRGRTVDPAGVTVTGARAVAAAAAGGPSAPPATDPAPHGERGRGGGRRGRGSV